MIQDRRRRVSTRSIREKDSQLRSITSASKTEGSGFSEPSDALSTCGRAQALPGLVLVATEALETRQDTLSLYGL